MTDDKYGHTILPAAPQSADTDAWVSGRTISIEFYMPEEPATASDGSTTTSGDRLNKGDSITLLGSGTTSVSLGSDVLTEECNTTGLRVILGAQSLFVVSALVSLNSTLLF